MQIVEYEDKYLNDIKNLLTELEEYIVSIDNDKLDIVHKEYYDKKAIIDLNEVKNNSGKCFLAIENNTVIGLIMGIITKYSVNDYLDYKCPKRGEIIELIVSQKARSKGIGQALTKRMEDYFKSVKCEYILVDVFAYNDNAMKFYYKQGFHQRMTTCIKKIKD